MRQVIFVFELGISISRFNFCMEKAGAFTRLLELFSRDDVEVVFSKICTFEFPDYFRCIKPGNHAFFIQFISKFDTEFLRLFLVLIIEIFLANLLDVLGNTILQCGHAF